jgi:hypothetical protein
VVCWNSLGEPASGGRLLKLIGPIHKARAACNRLRVSGLTDGATVARQTSGMSPDQRSRTPRLFMLCALSMGWGACGTAPESPPRRDAVAALQASSEHYAALQQLADSLAAAGNGESTEPSERSQAAAGRVAERIASVRGDFEAVTVAMTTSELEQTQSLWMRLALGQAALEWLYVDARTLAADPQASPAELRDLAVQLAGALELARASSRLAAARLQSPLPPPQSSAVAL